MLLAFLLALPAHPCVTCHPKQVVGYARTGMANSLGRPKKHPAGQFTHAPSGSKFIVRSGESGVRHRLERAGLAAEYPVAYSIGSGNQGHTYLVRVGDYLFQSPISYYARRGIWDVSPGYQRDRAPDFTRPVTADCLFCHSGKAQPGSGALNRYQDPPFAAEAISCERCHGPTEAHLAQPSWRNIVNPRKLSPRARDSVCEQCHLVGEARIPNPGRSFQDFSPGRELEDVFSVYTGGKNFKVVSQSEQLALSSCARSSGSKMWCGSCHDPHQKPANPRQYFRERCLACHGAAVLATHSNPTEDCVACHMPQRPSSDIAHTSFSDHRILRRPAGQATSPVLAELAPWHAPAPPLAKRNLGLAHISVGERDQSAYHLNEGFWLLAEIEKSFTNDPAVLTSLGLVLLRKDLPAEAVRMFERALRSDPSQAQHFLNLGVALNGAGEKQKAIQNLERAIELDPSLEDAYSLLAEIHAQASQPAMRRKTLERYLKFMPQNISARLALIEPPGVR